MKLIIAKIINLILNYKKNQYSIILFSEWLKIHTKSVALANDPIKNSRSIKIVS